MTGPAGRRGDRGDPDSPAVARLERVVATVGLTTLHWIYLVVNAPLLQTLPGWFWPFAAIDLHHAWLVPVLALALAAVWRLCAREGTPTALRLAAILSLGWGIQFGVAWLEGRGLVAIAEPIVRSGHGEFARVAVREPSLAEVARRYEERLEADPEERWGGGYARSKPPGFVLFYGVTQRISVWVAPPPTAQAALARFAVFAAVAWTLWSCLSVLPLYALARLFLDPRRAAMACLLWLVVPAFQLITGHLDQVLFPTLLLGAVALAGWAGRRASAGLAAAAGAACVVCNFMSFSLLPVWPLALGIGAICAERGPGRAPLGRGVALVAAFAGGAALVHGVLAFALDYDAFVRLERSLAVHAGWKKFDPSPRYRVYAALLDVLELGYWWGAPLVLAWMASFGAALSRVLARRVEDLDLLALATLGVLLALLVFGKTLAEVARLWLFLAPLACVAAIGQLARRFPVRSAEVALGMLMLQFGTLVLLKKYCDLFPPAD